MITPEELAAMKQRCEAAAMGPFSLGMIAHARADMPRLIAEVERLTTELKSARSVEAALKELREMVDKMDAKDGAK